MKSRKNTKDGEVVIQQKSDGRHVLSAHRGLGFTSAEMETTSPQAMNHLHVLTISFVTEKDAKEWWMFLLCKRY